MTKNTWCFDKARVDLEDGDARIALIHHKNGTKITIKVRLDETDRALPKEALLKRLQRVALHQIRQSIWFMDASGNNELSL